MMKKIRVFPCICLFVSAAFCFTGAIALLCATTPAAEESKGGASVSEAPSLSEKLRDLDAEIAKLPTGARRARFHWVSRQLSSMTGKAKETLQVTEWIEDLSAALREGKDAATAVPWFERKQWEGLRMLDNGKVGLAFECTGHGIALQSFFDLESETEFLSETATPFWSVSLAAGEEKRELTSSEGFTHFEAHAAPALDSQLELGVQTKWLTAQGEGLEKLCIECMLAFVGNSITASLTVDNPSSTWSVRSITFPRFALRQIGDSEQDDFLVVPHGSGDLRRSPIKTKATFSGRYPSGWCSMQLFSHYDTTSGLYLGIHDPYASTKELAVKAPNDSSLEITCTWPVPDAGIPGNDFECSEGLALETFRGDWFDAALIYRQWASRHADWWPEKGKWGRTDTPPWFEDIAVWALTGGTAEQVVEPVKKFAEYMGVPTAVHWYNWHVIPFDNDYPHYFPYKDGFPEGVKALREAGVRVMPYINGRLWDTDLDDFKNNAIRFCTKDEKGQPYIEEYGSGAKLSPMCSTTQLWQKTVQDLVLKLVGPEVNVDAVYVDQVAAAQPPLCYDKTHGHPLAGGNWWTTDGYWPMLENLQQKMFKLYPEKVLTTECNAEPYVHVFDGYLTWHFQYDNQIPLFAAVYGGKIQLFSRAYQGDSWKGLAMRMKTGQALVFGEQLGWINPQVLSDEPSAAFLRRMARMRYALRDYLARGEMARPPVLKGDIPTVTADWQWGGKRMVTTPAVLPGAWRAEDGRVALIFVNVSDAEQTGELDFDADHYGLPKSPHFTVTPRTEHGPGDSVREERRFQRAMHLKPHDTLALEISPPR